MARFDRIAAEYREHALRRPLTRADRYVFPKIELPGGVQVGMSVNL